MKKFLIILSLFAFSLVSLAQTPQKTTTSTKTSTQTKSKTTSKSKTNSAKGKKTQEKAKPAKPKEKAPSKEEIKAAQEKEKTAKGCEEANKKLVLAHQEMDNKQYYRAEELLKEALDICPSDVLKYKYELAWNNYLMKEFKKTIEILDTLSLDPESPADVYQLLGNAYDELGNQNMALITYDKGLRKHPNAGCLFLEKGNLAYKRSNFIGALEQYENGIEKDPTFASNYYRTSQIFLSSSEEVWGIMYGEIFMLLEKGGERAVEMSRKLYETYHSEITFTTKDIRVNFNDPTIVYSNSKTRPNLFPDNYENALVKACQGEKNITLESLIRIRKRFISIFYRESPSFKNVLFDYHKKLIDLGLFDAYNYWLFGYGNTQEASSWIKNNKSEFDRFISWQEANPFPIKQENVFSRYKME